VVYVDLAIEPLRQSRALILIIVFAATDWFDGYVARRFDQVSRVGQLLDPLSDRALTVTVAVGMVVGGIIPWWLVLLLLVRDVVVLLGALYVMSRGGQPPSVSLIGKTASFGLMFALPMFLASTIIGSVADPEPITRTIA